MGIKIQGQAAPRSRPEIMGRMKIIGYTQLRNIFLKEVCFLQDTITVNL